MPKSYEELYLEMIKREFYPERPLFVDPQLEEAWLSENSDK